MDTQPAKPLPVLLAGDDPVDREFFIEGMNDTGMSFPVVEVENGQELLTNLAKAALLPDLILLDLNMPVKDGRETLQKLKHRHCIVRFGSLFFLPPVQGLRWTWPATPAPTCFGEAARIRRNCGHAASSLYAFQ